MTVCACLDVGSFWEAEENESGVLGRTGHSTGTWVYSRLVSPGNLLCIELIKHISAQHGYSPDSVDQTFPSHARATTTAPVFDMLSPNPVNSLLLMVDK